MNGEMNVDQGARVMDTDYFQGEGGNTGSPREGAAPLTPDEARCMLDDAIAALGQDACEQWVRCGWLNREEAMKRVQQGESPDVVARDFAR